MLANVAYSHPVIKFGLKTTNQIQARKVTVGRDGISFLLKIYNDKYKVTLKSCHNGMITNVLAATSLAHTLGVPNDVIVEAIQMPIQVNSRFEHRKLKFYPGTLINDCYNANPESMKAALAAFQQDNSSARKIAVLGDMLELGENSAFWHRQLGRFLRKVPSLDYVILVGDMVKWTYMTLPVGLNVDLAPDWQAAHQMLEEKLSEKSVVLVKGSLGIGLRNLVDKLT